VVDLGAISGIGWGDMQSQAMAQRVDRHIVHCRHHPGDFAWDRRDRPFRGTVNIVL
jgi:hypothetical protein